MFSKDLRIFTSTIATVALLLFSLSAVAQGNSQNAPGKNKNLGHGNASNGIMGMIRANRHIFYAGEDELEIFIRFPRGSELIHSGEADAYVMIFDPEANWGALAINEEASPNNSRLFQMNTDELAELPEGVYQLGLVLTVPGGDPFTLADWYNGMLGLLAVQGLTVANEPLDIDENGDGFVDGDTTGDGFVDDEGDDTGDDVNTEDGTEDDDTAE